MTNEEAIIHIRDILAENNSIKPSMVVFESEKEALRVAIKALKRTSWISCSERLPEEAGLYLVSMHRLGYPQREIDGFVRGKWERYGNNVIAWMPLPEEYKKEAEA